jgi:hypothetical protein
MIAFSDTNAFHMGFPFFLQLSVLQKFSFLFLNKNQNQTIFRLSLFKNFPPPFLIVWCSLF